MEILLQKRLPALLENLPALTEPVLDCARNQGLPEAKVMKLDLALEEMLVNIVNYSYSESQSRGDIEIHCGLLAVDEGGSMLQVEIRDTGKPFDVTVEAAYPNISADIDERQIGGLGIFLVKKSMDKVEYQRQENKNVLQLGLRLPGDPVATDNNNRSQGE